MLLRKDERGVLLIGQPSHAWISGQLARAWGNARFGSVEPYEEVCLAAEQHDVGWATRDLEPLFNPETGLPRSFMEMPLEVHLGLFTHGPRSLLTQSRYAALLVSMHGRRLYERRDLSQVSASVAETIRRFLAAQRQFEQQLLDELHADPAQLERNSNLIWAWDYLSLALCLEWAPATAKRCPAAEGEVDLTMIAKNGAFGLEPWPFRVPELTVGCEGRRLSGTVDSEQSLRDELERAPVERLELTLHE
jgi:Protein of unknown function (DUF3891)